MVLRQIEAYLRRSGKTATRLGREVANDPRLVFDLRRGRQPGENLRIRIERFLEAMQ